MVFNYLLHRYPGLIIFTFLTGCIFLPSLVIQQSNFWGIETRGEMKPMIDMEEKNSYLAENNSPKKNDAFDLAFAQAVQANVPQSDLEANKSTLTQKSSKNQKSLKAHTVIPAEKTAEKTAEKYANQALPIADIAEKGVSQSDLHSEAVIAPCANDNASLIFLYCPTNITTTTKSECAQIQWEMPTATDNCNISNLDYDYEPNTCFPIGTTSVTYTATDLSGNQTKCRFKITVNNPDNTLSINKNIKVFETKKDRKGVLLQWVSNMDSNIDYFVIQKTDATGEFQGLDIVDGSIKQEDLTFHYYDSEPTAGESAYRVKAIMSDGSFQYSDVNKVDYKLKQDALIQYQTGENFIKFDLSRFEGKSVEVRFINQLGQTIETANVEEASDIPVKLDISHLLNGAYFIHLIPLNDERIMKKLFLQK